MVGLDWYLRLNSTANVQTIPQYLSYLPFLSFLLHLSHCPLKSYHSSDRWVTKLSSSSGFGYLKQHETENQHKTRAVFVLKSLLIPQENTDVIQNVQNFPRSRQLGLKILLLPPPPDIE